MARSQKKNVRPTWLLEKDDTAEHHPDVLHVPLAFKKKQKTEEITDFKCFFSISGQVVIKRNHSRCD